MPLPRLANEVPPTQWPSFFMDLLTRRRRWSWEWVDGYLKDARQRFSDEPAHPSSIAAKISPSSLQYGNNLWKPHLQLRWEYLRPFDQGQKSWDEGPQPDWAKKIGHQEKAEPGRPVRLTSPPPRGGYLLTLFSRLQVEAWLEKGIRLVPGQQILVCNLICHICMSSKEVNFNCSIALFLLCNVKHVSSLWSSSSNRIAFTLWGSGSSCKSFALVVKLPTCQPGQ